MPRIAIIGAGITGVPSAYALSNLGYDVTVYDRQRYPAMETSLSLIHISAASTAPSRALANVPARAV